MTFLTLSEIISWLNCNSPVITLLTTIVIAYASLVSSRIVRFEKKKERADRMPIVAFMEETSGVGPDSYRVLFVKNIGYGPALNVVRKISMRPVSDQAAEPSLTLMPLGPGDRVSAFHATLPGNYVIPILDDPEFLAFIECDDIFGQSYEFIYRERTLFGPTKINRRKMPSARADRI